MNLKIVFLFLLISLLTACSAGQAAPVNLALPVTEPTVPPQPTADVAVEVTDLPTTEVGLPTVTFTPKPPLEEGAWMQMPPVPIEVSEAMREVYQRGLALGNDPTHFSVIGDCQNVSSYFLSAFGKPGEFSLGSDYAYLQPTVDFYRESFLRKSLAVRGGFNVAAILSPLRADPKSCNKDRKS